MSDLVPVEIIANKILLIRGQKVMLDRDLAGLYNVPTKRLVEQVKRNLKRFPDDFMFQLTWAEVKSLRSHFATLNNLEKISSKRGKHIKYPPYVFTEQGVAMLSSVLNSDRAIMVNISIMRVFSKLKQLALSHSELLRKVDSLERKYGEHDKRIEVIFATLKKMLALPKPKKTGKMGF
ncbi:MAG: ORF6N domain-containing protein [Elusimicrobiota bacterium]|nr:ORF6N domain-containing protein [Elusimicrobiota bacterium]